MKRLCLTNQGFSLGVFCIITTTIHAGIPVWSFSPNGSPVVTVSAMGTATVSYTVTNNSKKPHQLVLSAKTPTGISQSGGPCVLAAKSPTNPNPTCTLTLSINGSALPANTVSGGPILCQANGTPNPNQCYQPSPGDTLVITRTTKPGATTLSTSIPSPSILALSVNNPSLNSALTGNARQITIKNTGTNEATGLTIAYPTWPGGTLTTTATSTCGTTLAAGDACTITINPGSNATSSCNTGIAPTPDTITVSATNVATAVTSHIVVLSYGCIYQGGYVYALDDTTPSTGSVGGKVVTTSDQALPFPNGIVWTSNGGTGGGSGGSDIVDVSYDTLPGIDQTSTSSTGSPTYAIFASFFASTYTNSNPFTAAFFSMCNGSTDGACNTGNILTFYNQFITNNTLGNGGSALFMASAGPTNIAYYAAGLCKQTIANYSDWYLPAICEMGYGVSFPSCGTSTTPTLQNIQSSLIDISGFSTPVGVYWSSTEAAFGAQVGAWYNLFASGGGNDQLITGKDNQNGVRCSRALTF
ncbi:transmembrane protein (fibronectin III domain and Gp5 C-terminal repeat) [Legionella steigerwaltii]|uniref:Transmembrane protein (Fibronectin III domain and Gp5 C-terminal repeat) n=1 Tax=Legionella steigerwaltii TaxID=460 RepID=A0A378L7N9_9GAMM|nr:DUF1566 domain-containing protein [Legionella steigerwaltii]KTD77533.1 hypothetical protein Lstg_1890 [Legionella steigerwaltii]STY22843.1 transmembrane protein (fibronectin III domain and Gp5 C-terminal repeat) [Legionella steigerwaltii]